MKKLIIGLLFLFLSVVTVNAQQWDTLGSGVTGGGIVFTLSSYNNNLIAGGIFNMVGGVLTGDLAQWNGASWDTVGLSSSPYIGLPVYAGCTYNDSLIIAGENGPFVEMAEWNGTTWNGMNTSEYESIGMTEIYDFIVYQGKLYAGGTIGKNFNSLSNIAVWNGSHWDTLPSGVVKKNGSPGIYCMAVYNGNLYAGGDFDTAGNIPANNIAMWNGSTWSAVGEGFNGSVDCLYVYNGTLYAGGVFDSSGTQPMNHVAGWNGSTWNALGSGVRNGQVSSIVNYGSILCVGGAFDSAGSQQANNIAYWDGNNWNAMGAGVTGNSTIVFALSVYKGALIVAGSFDSAGGIPANNIAQWTSPLGINTISGKNSSIKVYPNPSNGVFNLRIRNYELGMNTNIEVYNVLGEKVYTQSNIQNPTFNINLSGQPNGVYLYRVLNEDGSLAGTGKLVIQK